MQIRGTGHPSCPKTAVRHISIRHSAWHNTHHHLATLPLEQSEREVNLNGSDLKTRRHIYINGSMGCSTRHHALLHVQHHHAAVALISNEHRFDPQLVTEHFNAHRLPERIDRRVIKTTGLPEVSQSLAIPVEHMHL